MKTTLQSIYFNRNKNDVIDFFANASQSDVDEFHIRDITCKKRDISLQDYEKIIRILKNAHKKIILSTFPFETDADEKVKHLLQSVDYIEVNNIGILEQINTCIDETKIILGPYLKIYNQYDLEFFNDFNVTRIVIPYHSEYSQILRMIEAIRFNTELFVLGKIPVNLSWNCFLSMQHQKNRINCNKLCGIYPDALDIMSLNDIPLFKVIGPEVISYKTFNALREYKKFPVDYLRINPNFLFEKDHLCENLNQIVTAINIEDVSFLQFLRPDECCNGLIFPQTEGYKFILDI